MSIPTTAAAVDDPRRQQCVLALLADSTLLFNALRRHGQPFATHRTTTLDLALWFHRAPLAGAGCHRTSRVRQPPTAAASITDSASTSTGC
jgi:hypothetical protein